MQIFSPINKSLKNALKAAKEGDGKKAFAFLEPIFKADEIQEKVWKSTWLTAQKIFQYLGERDLAIFSEEMADQPDAASSYFHFGYALIEKDLYDPAFVVLKRGAALFPSDERILTELVCAYEQLGLYNEAKKALLLSRDLVDTSFFPRYLAVFNSIMTGNLEEANRWFEGLLSLLTNAPSDLIENYTHMFKNINAMLTRGKLLAPHTPLDENDIRGWNGVINGNVVLHLSDFYFETTKGRYGGIQEGAETLFSCIVKLKETLDALSFKPKRLLTFPDRDSTILGHAAADTFGCSVEVFSEETRDLPGLIVGYSSNLITDELYDLLLEAHVDQLFWCHASNWTQTSVAPDFISYFAQCASPPWEKKIVIDTENDILFGGKPKFKTKDPLKGSIEEILESLHSMVNSPIEGNAEEAKAIAKMLFTEEGGFNKTRKRSSQWIDSPV